jgi:hypothetical protein
MIYSNEPSKLPSGENEHSLNSSLSEVKSTAAVYTAMLNVFTILFVIHETISCEGSYNFQLIFTSMLAFSLG